MVKLSHVEFVVDKVKQSVDFMLNVPEESYSMGIGFGATQRGAYVQVKESLFVFNFLLHFVSQLHRI